MKNRLVKVVIAVVVTIVSVIALSGCSVTITSDEAVKLLKEAVSNSLSYDFSHENDKTKGKGIYNWKELVFDPDDIGDIKQTENTYVNVHGNADNYEIMLDENGNYVEYATRIEHKKNGIMTQEIIIGESISSEDKNVIIPYQIKKSFNSEGKHTSSTKQEMTNEDYLQSEEFEEYTLHSKLFELSLLDLNSFDFSINEAKLKKGVTVTSIKGKITDEYLSEFEIKYGYQSMFVGEYIEIEIAYERVTKIAVYQKETLGLFENVYEDYKIEIVYIGKNIDMPSFDDKDMKFV